MRYTIFICKHNETILLRSAYVHKQQRSLTSLRNSERYKNLPLILISLSKVRNSVYLKNLLILSHTYSICESLNSGYIGSESPFSASFSDTGKSPFL